MPKILPAHARYQGCPLWHQHLGLNHSYLLHPWPQLQTKKFSTSLISSIAGISIVKTTKNWALDDPDIPWFQHPFGYGSKLGTLLFTPMFIFTQLCLAIFWWCIAMYFAGWFRTNHCARNRKEQLPKNWRCTWSSTMQYQYPIISDYQLAYASE